MCDINTDESLMFKKSINERDKGKHHYNGDNRRWVVISEGFLFTLLASLGVLLGNFHDNCLELSVFINTMLTQFTSISRHLESTKGALG